jgi:3-oxocholest-4-en-26-oyl-CoA dehydrogenase beta subunit
MDFTLTESQLELAALTRRILASDRPHWKELTAALDTDLDLLDHCAVLIEIGRAASPIPYLPTLFTTGSATVAPWFWIVPEAEEILLPSGDLVPIADFDSEFEGPATHELCRRATIGVCAQQLGVLERALEMTATYAGERVQFGRPIGTFQAVAQRLADAFIDVEAVRLTMWQAALTQDPADIAVAKFWAADAGHRVAHTAVHVHGGVGIDLDSPVHRYFTMAKRLEFALGHATDALLSLSATLFR